MPILDFDSVDNRTARFTEPDPHGLGGQFTVTIDRPKWDDYGRPSRLWVTVDTTEPTEPHPVEESDDELPGD